MYSGASSSSVADPALPAGGRSPVQRAASSRRFETIALILFAALVSLVAALHEPWKDETQTWRMAIDSDGVGALVRNARYEGHPLLFHLLLQALGHLSRSWWAPVVLHVLIACGVAWIILRHAPFDRIEKALLVASYYVAYEFAVIVRPYGLGLLLALGACAAWSAPRRRPLLTIVLLMLLANTSAFGLLVALVAAGTFVVDWLWPDDAPPRIGRKGVVVGVVCLMFAAAAARLVVVQLSPPPDAAFSPEALLAEEESLWSLGWTLTIPLRAMTPLAVVGEGTVQWNMWLFEPWTRAALGIQVLLSMALVTVGALVTARRRASLLLYLAGVGGFVLFFHLFIDGYARHHAHIVVVWIMAVWLSRSGPATRWPARLQPVLHLAERRQRLFAYSLLPMVLATAQFAVGDALLPFADARHVAEFLRARSLHDVPLVALSSTDAQPVAALLDRPLIFPLEPRTGTFVVWGRISHDTSPTADQIRGATAAALESRCTLVHIGTTAFDLAPELVSAARLIYETPGRPMSSYRYRVWLQTAPSSPRCPGGPA